VAAAQIGELVDHQPADGPVPLCVFDAGYDPEALARVLAELDGERVAVLVRVRSDRCFYADLPAADGIKVGRPRPTLWVMTRPRAWKCTGARLGRRAHQDAQSSR
jgi:hypothetical protein